MTKLAFEAISIPDLPDKPRTRGLTAIIDKGHPLEQVRQMLVTAAPWVDVVKFGWGTSRLQRADVIRDKVAAYAEHGVTACTGGTLFEAAVAQGRLDAMLDEAAALGFRMVEVANGVLPIEQDEKLALISRVREAGFTVWSEVGKKEPEEDRRITMGERLAAARAELEAGSAKVILEGRESGTIGIYDAGGAPAEELLARAAEEVGTESLVFEAPRKSQQLWMIRHFGREVNLGNVAFEDVISLATLRTGMRGDTLADEHLGGVRVWLEMGVGGALAARERGGVVVLIDALRASATMVTALGMGMRAVRPVSSVEQCVGEVTAGERGGKKLPTLDHGNSPLELLGRPYQGKELVLTTTNGTECLLAAKSPETTVLVGTTLNATAVARAGHRIAMERGQDVTLLMAGRNNQPCIEDELAASEILHAMPAPVHLQGSPPRSSDSLERDFFEGESGMNLEGLGYGEDVRFCARMDVYDVVPEFTAGVLRPLGDS